MTQDKDYASGPSYADLLAANEALQQELRRLRPASFTPERGAEGTGNDAQDKIEARHHGAVVDAAPVAIARTDACSGVILNANRAFHEMLGYTGNELLGRRLPDVTWHEDRENSWAQFSSAISSRSPGEVYFKRYTQKNGAPVWAKVVTTHVYDVERPYVIAVILDLSEQHAIEEALRQKTRQLESLSAIRMKALIARTLDEVFRFAVEQLKSVIRADLASLLELSGDQNHLLLRAGAGWREGAIGEIVQDYAHSQAGYALSVNHPVVMEDADHETRFEVSAVLKAQGVRSGMSVIINGVDKPYGVLGAHTRVARTFADTEVEFLQDIANLLSTCIRQFRSERELADSESRFRAIFENMAVAVSITNDRGQPLAVNDALCAMFRSTRDELLKETFQSLTLPEDLAKEKTHWEALRLGQVDSYRMEKRYRRGDGETLWTHLTRSCVRDADGHPLYFIGVAEDITERKKAEEALQRKQAELEALNATLEERVRERTSELARRNEELDQFAYSASHDLKSPLRGIANLARWIEADAGESLPAESRRHLEILQQRAERMEKLLTDLLAYSRADRVEGIVRAFDPAKVIAAIVETNVPQERFRVEVQSETPTVFGYSAPFEMVMRNLIDNAVKHHGDGPGLIRIAASEIGDMVEFSVADDGPGIPPEYHARVFEMFQTLKPRDHVEGSGMGLAFVKKAIEARGGTIRLESTPGRGAAFHFTWPLRETEYKDQ